MVVCQRFGIRSMVRRAQVSLSPRILLRDDIASIVGPFLHSLKGLKDAYPEIALGAPSRVGR